MKHIRFVSCQPALAETPLSQISTSQAIVWLIQAIGALIVSISSIAGGIISKSADQQD